MAARDNAGPDVVAILTLERHKDGIWITRLVEELSRRFERDSDEEDRPPTCNNVVPVTIEVVTVESLHLEDYPMNFIAAGFTPKWKALINRCSDAADPILAKSVLAVLEGARLAGIPLFNGPRCYSIGCNKVLHHAVFRKAGLESPFSVVVRFGRASSSSSQGGGGKESGGSTTVTNSLLRAAQLLRDQGCDYPFLLKPNSAGFGEGMALFADERDLLRYAAALDQPPDAPDDASLGPSSDGVALLQEYVDPLDGSMYRVWFLNGKVQCAVKRALRNGKGGGADLTAGCVASGCSLADRKRFFAWRVPPTIQEDIVKIIRTVGDDCDAGSVELLFNESNQRIYFDLNMLSTLPMTSDGSVLDDHGVWPVGYNPWAELGDAVIGKFR